LREFRCPFSLRLSPPAEKKGKKAAKPDKKKKQAGKDEEEKPADDGPKVDEAGLPVGRHPLNRVRDREVQLKPLKHRDEVAPSGRVRRGRGEMVGIFVATFGQA
jgi:hypothetical protein